MRKPRSSLGGVGAVIAFAALLALFAIVLSTAHAKARRSLEAGFNEHAKVSAALTDSLFEASASTSQATYSRTYGSARVPNSRLTALAREGKSVDAALLDSGGSVIALSAGTPAAVRSQLEARPAYISSVLAGQSFAISNVMVLGAGQSVVQYAQAFTSAFGRRVLVVGFAPSLLSGFIGGYLAGTTTAEGSRAFVLDGNGVPIAAAAHDRRPFSAQAEAGLARALGSRTSGPIGRGRYFTMSPVRHSAWRVIVTTPQSALFASVRGVNEWVPWMLFGAFALVLALVLVLGARALRNAAAQRERDAQFRAVVAERLGLAAITETMAEGVVVTRDADMRIVYTNQAFEAMLGYDRGELQHEPVSRIGHDSRLGPQRSEIGEAVKRQGSWRGELQLDCKDGSLLWCLSTVTMLEHPEHGTVWIAVHSDIGDRKRIESELERATTQAIEASRSKSLFVANMSHEIRTPLNGVIGMTDLLRETGLDPVQRDYVDALATSGEALLALISDVLDFSKIEAGRLELDPTDFELRPTVEEACQILAEQAHGKGLEISHWVDDDVPVAVRGDRARLRQILLNLVSNAVKFTAHGEVSVRVRRDSDSLLHFSVSDTGVGIDAEQAAHLFEAFVQADQSTTRQFGGTGLGLTISSQLVRLMGGEIGAETREQGGSNFWFTAHLPQVASASRPRRAPELQGVRALVIDDNATSRTILSHYLSSWGLTCETAADASGALDVLESAARAARPFRLVLLDSNMPQMGGAELAHEIRRRAPLEVTKMIVLSSTALERRPFADADVSAFFAKPARQSELHNAIVSAFAQLPAEPEPEPGREHLAEAIAQMRGKVVLIAEDNDINLALARAMLHKRGLHTAIARNGNEAVRMAHENDYAAILMDCQMPELDGYEATRRIRRHENGDRVPIIALTAHSMSGDRERCMAVGMDDYLPKPIRADQLEEIIKRWLPDAPAGLGGGHRGEVASNGAARSEEAGMGRERDEVASNGNATPDHASANGGRVLDEGAIGQLKETLSEPMRGRLLETFDSQLESCVDGIAEAVRRGDPAERRRLAHLLKGSSATIGATRLSETCERLERTGRASDPEVGEEQVAELRALAQEARRALEQQLL